jgi:hypothetical protein
LVVVKLYRIPGAEYKYINRKLKITAQNESPGKVAEVFEQRELIVPYEDESFFVPFLIQKGATEITIKAELKYSNLH